MTATYTKLRSGEWGIRVQGQPSAGDVIQVAKRDGSVKTETVAKIVWRGDGIAICAVARRPRYQGDDGIIRTRDGREMVRGCAACRALGDMCRECRHDQYDW